MGKALKVSLQHVYNNLIMSLRGKTIDYIISKVVRKHIFVELPPFELLMRVA